jgi:cell wall-associated NlpC family hydrolase
MSRAAIALPLLGLLCLAPRASAQSAADVRPVIALPRMTLGTRDSVAAVSRAQLGARYRLGAHEPGRRFDCSGLVQYVMSVFNLTLPRTAAEQARLGVAVPRNTARLLPGDLLTFGYGKRVTHVGIYVGDGMYVHASSRRHTVVEVPLPAPGTRESRTWKGVRRLFATDTASAAPAPSLPSAAPAPPPPQPVAAS